MSDESTYSPIPSETMATITEETSIGETIHDYSQDVRFEVPIKKEPKEAGAQRQQGSTWTQRTNVSRSCSSQGNERQYILLLQ